jgi:hypothetical protein
MSVPRRSERFFEMGIFGRKPKTAPHHSCRFCSEIVPVTGSEKREHYKTHLIKVTDNNGLEAYTFKCPQCGPMALSWGGGRPSPKDNAVSAIAVHYMERHSDHEVM